MKHKAFDTYEEKIFIFFLNIDAEPFLIASTRYFVQSERFERMQLQLKRTAIFHYLFLVERMNYRDAGIVTVSVGVGSMTKYDTLLDVAGNESRLFSVSTYTDLNSITGGLVNIIESSATTSLEGKELVLCRTCILQYRSFVFFPNKFNFFYFEYINLLISIKQKKLRKSKYYRVF